MSANSGVVGILRALLTVDTAEFDTGMRRASKNAVLRGKELQDALGNNTRGVAGLTASIGRMAPVLAGAFSVTAIVGFGRQLIATSDALVKMSDKTGIGVEGLQRLQTVGDQAGNTLDELTGAITQMQNRLASGDRSALAALQKLGIELGELEGLSADRQLMRISDALREIKDPAQQVAISMDLMGRTGANVLPTLKEGFDDVGDGATLMSDQAVRAFDAAGDAITKWGRTSMAVVGNVIGQWLDDWFIAKREFEKMPETIQKLLPGSPGVFGAGASGALPMPSTTAMREILDTLDAQREKTAKAREEADRLAKSLAAIRDRALGLDVVQDMQELLRAIGGVAGVSKMSADEVKRFRAQLDEAIAAARRNGLDKLALSLEGVRAQLVLTAAPLEASARGMLTFSINAEQMAEAARQAMFATQGLTEEGLIPMADVSEELLRAGMHAHVFTRDLAETFEQAEEKVSGIWAGLSDGLSHTLSTLDRAISGSFAQMVLGAKTFKDAFLDIWGSIKAALINIFADIASAFVGGMLKKMVAGLAGTAVAGAATGAVVGGGAAAATAGAGAAAAGGIGGSIAAFATNPLTLAIAGGIGAFFGLKKLFGGGEGAEVNDRRDKFQAQFGGFMGLAQKMTEVTKEHGGGSLFSALQAAKTHEAYAAAQGAIIGRLAKGGIRNVKAFNLGGFVPPGVVQPAVLHGGAFGEAIVPLKGPGQSLSGVTLNLNVTNHIRAHDAQGVREFVESPAFGDAFRDAVLFNKNFIASAMSRAVAR